MLEAVEDAAAASEPVTYLDPESPFELRHQSPLHRQFNEASTARYGPAFVAGPEGALPRAKYEDPCEQLFVVVEGVNAENVVRAVLPVPSASAVLLGARLVASAEVADLEPDGPKPIQEAWLPVFDARL